MAKALGEVPGVELKDTIKPAKTKPQFVTINLDISKSDVGAVAKAVGGAKTPHAKKVPPAAAVAVPVKGIAKGDTKKVRRALAKVKGVDAKRSSAGKGQVIVQLDKKGGAQLAEIRKALKKLTK